MMVYGAIFTIVHHNLTEYLTSQPKKLNQSLRSEDAREPSHTLMTRVKIPFPRYLRDLKIFVFLFEEQQHFPCLKKIVKCTRTIEETNFEINDYVGIRVTIGLYLGFCLLHECQHQHNIAISSNCPCRNKSLFHPQNNWNSEETYPPHIKRK